MNGEFHETLPNLPFSSTTIHCFKVSLVSLAAVFPEMRKKAKKDCFILVLSSSIWTFLLFCTFVQHVKHQECYSEEGNADAGSRSAHSLSRKEARLGVRADD